MSEASLLERERERERESPGVNEQKKRKYNSGNKGFWHVTVLVTMLFGCNVDDD